MSDSAPVPSGSVAAPPRVMESCVSSAPGTELEPTPLGVRPDVLQAYVWLEACGFDPAGIEAYVGPREGTQLPVLWPEGVFLRLDLCRRMPFAQRRVSVCDENRYVCCRERLLPFARVCSAFFHPTRFPVLYGSSGGVYCYDTDEDCVYLLGDSLVSFCRDGLRRLDPVYRDGLVLPRLVVTDVISKLIEHQYHAAGFSAVVAANRGLVCDFMGQLSGVDGELMLYNGDHPSPLVCGGRVIDTTAVLCAVVRRLNCLFEVFAALGHRLAGGSFNAHFVLLIDRLGVIYAFEPRVNRVFRLADDFSAFIRLGSQKAMFNFRFDRDQRGIGRLERPPHCTHLCNVIMLDPERDPQTAQAWRTNREGEATVRSAPDLSAVPSSATDDNSFVWLVDENGKTLPAPALPRDGRGGDGDRERAAALARGAVPVASPPPDDRPVYVRRSSAHAFSLAALFSFGESIGHIAYCGPAGRYFDPKYVDLDQPPEGLAADLCVRYDAALCARACFENIEHIAGMLWQEELEGLLVPGQHGTPALVFDSAVRDAIRARRRGIVVPDTFDNESMHEALQDPACRRCIERRRLLLFRRDHRLRHGHRHVATAAAVASRPDPPVSSSLAGAAPADAERRTVLLGDGVTDAVSGGQPETQSAVPGLG